MSDTHLKHIESEFNKLKDDLTNHKNGILDKLKEILTDSINDNLENAKSKIDWD